MRMGKGHGQTADSLDPGTHEKRFHARPGPGVQQLPDRGGRRRLADRPARRELGTASARRRHLDLQAAQGRDLPQRPRDCRRGRGRLHQPPPRRGVAVRGQADRRADHRHQGRRQAHRGPSASKPATPTSRSSSATTTCRSCRARGGKPDWPAGVGAGAYRIKSFEPGCAWTSEKYADYWNPDRGALRCGPDDQHHRPHRPHQRPHHRRGGRHRPGGSEDCASDEASKGCQGALDRRHPALHLPDAHQRRPVQRQQRAPGPQARHQPRGDGGEDPAGLRRGGQRPSDRARTAFLRQGPGAAHLRPRQGEALPEAGRGWTRSRWT